MQGNGLSHYKKQIGPAQFLFIFRASEMSDMATHIRVMMPSVFILWLALALYVVSICRGDVRYFVTEDFFNKIVSGDVPLSSDYGVIATEDLFIRNLFEIPDGCEGYGFYTYDDFINATNGFSGFGTTGTSDDKKREIAAFFGNIAYETLQLCYVQQINGGRYCSNNSEYPCTSGRQYYGRGPLQLRGNANYGAAGTYLGEDLLNNPGLVAQDDLISWKTALWLWNVNSNCHTSITSGRGFGATIHALSGVNGFAECNGASTSAVNSRVNHYTSYCSQLGVDPGSNLSC